MMDELKNCPFCGGRNTYIDDYTTPVGIRWRVVCLDCMAMVDDGCEQQKYRAIEAWNRRADGWIPIANGLPNIEDYTRVLIYFDNGIIEMWNPILISESMKTDRMPTKVTHWMPLPQPPEDK